jgi:hypothetical protein
MFDEQLDFEKKAEGDKQTHKGHPGPDQQLQMLQAAREGQAPVEVVVAEIEDDKNAQQHKHGQMLEGRCVHPSPPPEESIADLIGKIERRGQGQHIQRGQQDLLPQKVIQAFIRGVHAGRIVAYTHILRPSVCWMDTLGVFGMFGET